jgi:bifunctional UDP-N-acetylglucosamine pyrophosphorylase / glucosamine-1-phosphate N-acetyltransferase
VAAGNSGLPDIRRVIALRLNVMAERPLSAVVLAAGEGTRMHSARPKPLHRICGRPMILHVLDALAEIHIDRVVVVVGHGGEWVTKTLLENAPREIGVEFVEQATHGGTGDALAVALTAFPQNLADSEGDVLVLPGDTPLVRPPTLASLVRQHRGADAAATLLTARLVDPTGHDRVVRGRNDEVIEVLNAGDNDASPEAVGPDAADLHEIATAIACYRHGVLAAALRRLHPVGPRREHSLTGMAGVLHDAGYNVAAVVLSDPMEAAGVNDRAQLAVAEAELRDRINERWMRRGVTMWDPERTYVDTSVELEPDSVLLPGVILQGTTKVAAGAEIGPESQLVDTTVGEGAVVNFSVARHADIGPLARVGPYCVLEPGARVLSGQVIGAHTVLEAEAG